MILRCIILGVLASAAITNQLMEWNGLFIFPLYHYLDDLLAVPIALGIFHLFHNLLRKNENYRLPFQIILLAVAGFAFHFELLMPLISAKYTADIWDVMMYAAGGLFYLFIMNRRFLRRPQHFTARLPFYKRYR